MRVSRLGFKMLRLGLLLSGLSTRALATTIEYEAINLADVVPGQDLWQYNYYVSGRTFSANQDFTIFFDYVKYSQLQSPPPAVSPDWNLLVLQPDLQLPDNGAYDALAVVNNPSTANVFHLTFVWLGAGTPGSQPFTIDQLDAQGNVLQVLETGNTIPLQTTPEPGTWLLCLAGLATLTFRMAKRRPASLERIVPLALLVISFGFSAQSLSADQFQVVGRNLVTSTRVTRTQWNYTYNFTIQNTGAAAFGVTATVTSSAPTTVVNCNLTFGDIAAGQSATSTNTCTIEQDRTVPFDPAVLWFKFKQGTDTAPIADAGPDQTAKVGQTVTLDGSKSHGTGGTIVALSLIHI